MSSKDIPRARLRPLTPNLIDLNSPDGGPNVFVKMSSPLIPSPKLSRCNTFPGRDSLDNNPFDKILKESNLQLHKETDPFEMVCDKAFRNEDYKIKIENVDKTGNLITVSGLENIPLSSKHQKINKEPLLLSETECNPADLKIERKDLLHIMSPLELEISVENLEDSVFTSLENSKEKIPFDAVTRKNTFLISGNNSDDSLQILSNSIVNSSPFQEEGIDELNTERKKTYVISSSISPVSRPKLTIQPASCSSHVKKTPENDGESAAFPPAVTPENILDISSYTTPKRNVLEANTSWMNVSPITSLENNGDISPTTQANIKELVASRVSLCINNASPNCSGDKNKQAKPMKSLKRSYSSNSVSTKLHFTGQDLNPPMDTQEILDNFRDLRRKFSSVTSDGTLNKAFLTATSLQLQDTELSAQFSSTGGAQNGSFFGNSFNDRAFLEPSAKKSCDIDVGSIQDKCETLPLVSRKSFSARRPTRFELDMSSDVKYLGVPLGLNRTINLQEKLNAAARELGGPESPSHKAAKKIAEDINDSVSFEANYLAKKMSKLADGTLEDSFSSDDSINGDLMSSNPNWDILDDFGCDIPIEPHRTTKMTKDSVFKAIDKIFPPPNNVPTDIEDLKSKISNLKIETATDLKTNQVVEKTNVINTHDREVEVKSTARCNLSVNKSEKQNHAIELLENLTEILKGDTTNPSNRKLLGENLINSLAKVLNLQDDDVNEEIQINGHDSTASINSDDLEDLEENVANNDQQAIADVHKFAEENTARFPRSRSLSQSTPKLRHIKSSSSMYSTPVTATAHVRPEMKSANTLSKLTQRNSTSMLNTSRLTHSARVQEKGRIIHNEELPKKNITSIVQKIGQKLRPKKSGDTVDLKNVNGKGPLKAVIPLGKMAKVRTEPKEIEPKRGSLFGKKTSSQDTPRRNKSSMLSFHKVTSTPKHDTPIATILPMAQSTPDICSVAKIDQVVLKKLSTCNFSPLKYSHAEKSDDLSKYQSVASSQTPSKNKNEKTSNTSKTVRIESQKNGVPSIKPLAKNKMYLLRRKSAGDIQITTPGAPRPLRMVETNKPSDSSLLKSCKLDFMNGAIPSRGQKFYEKHTKDSALKIGGNKISKLPRTSSTPNGKENMYANFL